MMPLGLNHMSMPHSSTIALLDVAESLNFVGVELRNDVPAPLFDGKTASEILREAKNRGLRILALAEVYAFNDNSETTRFKVQDLAELARDCGAEAIALIPRIGTQSMDGATQRAQLRAALEQLQPVLEDNGVIGLIEPLGFEHSSLRQKSNAVAVLNDMGRPDCFALIHDTFHHALAGEDEIYADATRIVHISGVTDATVAPLQMTDAHRGLVDQKDRLGTIAQLKRFHAQGFEGPCSFEIFAPDVHQLTDPAGSLLASSAFISSQVAGSAA